MKYILIILTLLFLACETTPKNPERWIEREINACLPTAIIFKQALRKYDIWAEVFSYRWVDKEDGKMHGHAMVAYLYPPGYNKLYTYDSMGSYRVRAYKDNVAQVAQQAHKERGNWETTYSAEWIK